MSVGMAIVEPFESPLFIPSKTLSYFFIEVIQTQIYFHWMTYLEPIRTFFTCFGILCASLSLSDFLWIQKTLVRQQSTTPGDSFPKPFLCHNNHMSGAVHPRKQLELLLQSACIVQVQEQILHLAHVHHKTVSQKGCGNLDPHRWIAQISTDCELTWHNLKTLVTQV